MYYLIYKLSHVICNALLASLYSSVDVFMELLYKNSASEVTTLRRYGNMTIIVIISIRVLSENMVSPFWALLTEIK